LDTWTMKILYSVFSYFSLLLLPKVYVRL